MQNTLPITDSIRIIKGKRSVDRVLKSNSTWFRPDERYKITVQKNYIVINRCPDSYMGKSMTGSRTAQWHSFGLISDVELPYGEFMFHPESNIDRIIVKYK